MYITDPAEQIQLIKDMTQLRKDMEKYEVYYHHSFTNQMWKSFFPRASGEELGPKLLRHEPLPEDVSELLHICLAEDAPQNAIGLGIELSVPVQKWPDVFRIIEKNYSSYLSRQVRLFLQHLRPENFREYMERHDRGAGRTDDLEKDLKKLVWRSRKLKFKSYIY